MTIMNSLSSNEETLAKSKQKASKNMTTPKVELNQQNIVQSSQKKSKKKKKKAAKSETSSSAKESETNKDKYFHVEKSIATSFRSTDSASFSLLSLFGKAKTSEDQESEDEPVETKECPDERSSSEECDETEVRSQQVKNTASGTDYCTPAPVGTSMTMVKKPMPPPDRPFFFINDDPRLSDGVEYFHRKLSEEELWLKWSSGFKNDVRKLFITRPKRFFKMTSQRNEDFPKKMKSTEEDLDK